MLCFGLYTPLKKHENLVKLLSGLLTVSVKVFVVYGTLGDMEHLIDSKYVSYNLNRLRENDDTNNFIYKIIGYRKIFRKN